MSKKIDPQVINERLRALRRLMQEEEQRAAEEDQPITNAVNMIAWSVVCVMIGWIIALI